MSEKQEDNVIEFSKSQKRRIAIQKAEEDKVTDEDWEMFLKAFFGPYRGGYCPE